MNILKLKDAEQRFFAQYPGGFHHPDIIEIGKKHKMDAYVTFAQSVFSKKAFADPLIIIENMVRMVSKSSMVSIFEKPRFRDAIYAMSEGDKQRLVTGLYNWLHTKNKQKGFETICDTLAPVKLAKWSIVTVWAAYLNPNTDIFIKPTTAKDILAYFEVKNLVYNAKPTWNFYIAYQALINDMKTKVSSELSPSNAAFSGFLMMTMH